MMSPDWTGSLRRWLQRLWQPSAQPLHPSEQRALAFLQRQGLRLLTCNYRCKGGEIDLVMLDRQTTPDTLVFVEVRQRSSSEFGGAAASVTAAKQQRLRRAAHLYLQQMRSTRRDARNGAASPPPCRFDVLAIDGTPSGKDPESRNNGINWIRNAFDS